MPAVICHLTALRALADHSQYDDLTGLRRYEMPRKAVPKAGDPEIEALARRYGAPVDVVSPSNSMRSCAMLVRHALSAQALGHGLVRLADGVYCLSPEACLCQLASKMDIVDSVRLLAWMGGTYGLGAGGCMVGRHALVSARTLGRRLAALDGLHGVKTARRALLYATLGSASPAESDVATMLGLPVSLGGAGLVGFEANGTVKLGEELQRGLGAACLRCDFLWRNKGVAVEYDSDAFHTGADRIEHDSVRRNALIESGFVVLTLTRRQLRDFDAFDEFVERLRKRLGIANQQSWNGRRSLRRALHRRILHDKLPNDRLADLGFGSVWR